MGDGGRRHRPTTTSDPGHRQQSEETIARPGGGVQADLEWARNRIAAFFRGQQLGAAIYRKPQEPARKPDEEREVSQPGESAEQEADAVADRVADQLHDREDEGATRREPGREKAPPVAAKLQGIGRKIFLSKKDDKSQPTGENKDENAASVWTPGAPLPNAAKAVVDPAKFTSYSMDPNNKNNSGKSAAFKAIGFDVDDEAKRAAAASEVMNQLKAALPGTPATAGKASEHGQRFEVRVPIRGPNGAGTLVTAWQIDKGADAPRLITNWLEVHK